MMKEMASQREKHASYRKHRGQVWTQILLPMILACLVFLGAIAAACLSAFRGSGDVSRWAAMSTIWLIIPGLFLELIALAALFGMIYLMGKLRAVVPPYSYLAQRVVHRVASTTQRGAEMVRSPRLAVLGFVDLARRRFARAERK